MSFSISERKTRALYITFFWFLWTGLRSKNNTCVHILQSKGTCHLIRYFFPSSARKFPVDSIVCPECQNVVKDYLHLNHIRDTQKWSDCEICGLILSESLKRNRIQEFHSKFENWERLECDYCTNGLKNDQLRACTNDRLFVCRVCNEGFFEIRNQILHIKRVHLKPTSVFIRG